MSAAVVEAASLGLYLHVPFCRSKCPYCDFYSLPGGEDLMDAYTHAVVRALITQPFGPRRVDTVYFGGGTPSLLGERRLLQILESCSRAFSLSPHAEVTLEANPSSDLAGLLPGLRRGGFNRLSLGVQSLEDGELLALGRGHTAGQAVAAVELAADAGFDNLSADLMLAVPGQTAAGLERTLRRVAGLPLTHLSAYLLKVEEGTPFGRERDTSRFPDEDAAADRYLQLVHSLGDLGFAQYEISNFARPGLESRHNLKYWRCREYLGLGPSAHSFLEGRRFFFPRSLPDFLAWDPVWEHRVDDGPGGDFEEAAMLRLRLTEGLDLDWAARTFSVSTAPIFQRARLLERQGLTRLEGAVVSLTPRGFLLSNSVTARLLYG